MPPQPQPGMTRSLCESCRHCRQVISGRGSRFLLCTLSQQDRRYAKYPSQPVVRCQGHAPESPQHEEFSVKPGRYRHYKGQQYIVLGVARHSETEEELVVYRQDYGSHGLWVRPKSMFLESVEVQGQQVPRFEYVGPEGD